MPNGHLETLFHDGLRDIYYAEQKVLKALPKMMDAAQSADLKAAFEQHLTETEEQVGRLEQVCHLLGKQAEAKRSDRRDCEGG